jgi:UDP-glucose 4-epimerase
MTRVLVTGGAGFIGSHVVEKLLEAGHDVVVVDNLTSGARENLSRAGRARLIVADILELPQLEKELSGVEVIYHFAALISSQDSLRNPEKYLETNVAGTTRVIQTAASVGARRILFASSSTVYGSSGETTKRESTLPAPITVYALSKLAGEHLLALYAPIHGFSHTSLRMFNVYGPRQSPNHPYANVTCKFAHAVSATREIDVYGDGEQSRDFVYVDDVARAFFALASGSKRPIYNLGSGTSRSINELIDVVERVGETRLVRRDQAPWPNDIRSIRADVDSLLHDHDLRATTSLDQGIAQTIRYFRELSTSAP